MKNQIPISISIAFLLGLGLCVGCGEKADKLGVAPPPVGADTGVTLKTDSQEAPKDGGVKAPDTGPSVTDLPPPTSDEGLKAITKGMTAEQVQEFKETASFETHDTQISLISEAANTYYNEFKKAPASVEALVQAGHLPRVLKAPKGKKYVIDPMTLDVTSVNQ